MYKSCDRVELELANISEAQAINDLLNLSYRGEKGWTTESVLLDGDRSTIADVKLLIKDSLFLLYKEGGVLVSCINLQKTDHEVFLGAFAVHPDHQARGLGKLILRAAEEYSINELNSKIIVMVVVSERKELIAFYERRGYQRTGVKAKYPLHLNVGTPKSDGLTIENLSKRVL